MKQNKYLLIGLTAVIIIIALVGIVAYNNSVHAITSGNTSTIPYSNSSAGSKIRIVAAENFWGSLTQQLGGNRVNVTSIVTDPNADPT